MTDAIEHTLTEFRDRVLECAELRMQLAACREERDGWRAVVQKTASLISYRLGPVNTLRDIEAFCKAALEPKP